MGQTLAQHNNITGFTVIELMLTIAVLAVLVTVGVPSFQGMVERNQLTTNINRFISSLVVARSEAIKRNQRVAVCPSSDGTSCNAAGGYDNGWIIYVDNNADNSRQVAGEELIWRGERLPDNMTLRGSNANNMVIPYTPSGRIALISGSVRLCIDNQTDRARAVTIIPSGRVRLANHDTSGVPILNNSAMDNCAT